MGSDPTLTALGAGPLLIPPMGSGPSWIQPDGALLVGSTPVYAGEAHVAAIAAALPTASPIATELPVTR